MLLAAEARAAADKVTAANKAAAEASAEANAAAAKAEANKAASPQAAADKSPVEAKAAAAAAEATAAADAKTAAEAKAAADKASAEAKAAAEAKTAAEAKAAAEGKTAAFGARRSESMYTWWVDTKTQVEHLGFADQYATRDDVRIACLQKVDLVDGVADGATVINKFRRSALLKSHSDKNVGKTDEQKKAAEQTFLYIKDCYKWLKDEGSAAFAPTPEVPPPRPGELDRYLFALSKQVSKKADEAVLLSADVSVGATKSIAKIAEIVTDIAEIRTGSIRPFLFSSEDSRNAFQPVIETEEARALEALKSAADKAGVELPKIPKPITPKITTKVDKARVKVEAARVAVAELEKLAVRAEKGVSPPGISPVSAGAVNFTVRKLIEEIKLSDSAFTEALKVAVEDLRVRWAEAERKITAVVGKLEDPPQPAAKSLWSKAVARFAGFFGGRS